MRRLVYALSLLVVTLAASVVTVPFVEVRPGSATPVEDLVTIDAATTEISGTYDLLTVRVVTPPIAMALLAWADPDRSLEPRSTAVPPGVDQDVFRDLQRAQFSRAFRTAVAVGAGQAGFDVRVVTRPVVFGVIDGGPSDGLLDVGDVIRRIDGRPVESAEQLIDVLRRLQDPGPVELVVASGDEERTVTVVTERLPGLEQPALGIQVDTIADEAELPFDAELAATNIGGPSAGMMVALTTVDLLLEEDLAAGRTIAGTGTIDGDGRIGTVGGVAEKVRAAQQVGVDLLLVPEEQVEIAVAASDGTVRIVGVGTLTEAIEALRSGLA